MSLLRSRFPVFYRCAMLLALWAMLVPVAATLLGHQPEMARGLVHICGMASHDHGKAQGATPSCPLCQNLHQLGHGFAPPQVALRAVFRVRYVGREWGRDERPVAFVLIPQARPRAPPAFV